MVDDETNGTTPLLVGLVVACAVLGALQSTIWYGPGAWWGVAWLGNAVGLGEVASSQLAQPDADYFFVGRLLVLVYIGWIFVGFGAPAPSGWVAWSRRVAWFVALTGDVLAYWVSAALGPAVRALGFWQMEVPALLALVVLSTWTGWRRWRAGDRSWATRAHLGTVLLVVVALAWLRYMPHGLILPLLVVSWLGRGGASRRREGSPARRRRVAGSVALFLVVVPLLALPYRPITIIGPEIGAIGEDAVVPPVPGLRLHVFDTGANRMSSLLVGPHRPWRSVPAFVIEHPTAGLLVFDCGLSDAVARDGEQALHGVLPWLMESRGAPDWTLVPQMRGAGLEPGEVTSVVLSHLHEDHMGALPYFRGAQLHVGEGAPLHALEGSSLQVEPISAPDPFAPFAGALDLFGDDSVLLVPAAGHTDHDVMLYLRLESGPVLLTGDAVVHEDWLVSDDVERIVTDPVRAARVRNQVRALLEARPEIVPLFGHDLRHASRLASRPDVTLHERHEFVAPTR